MQRADFDREIDNGSLYVGSPETVSRKIVATMKALRLSRFDIKTALENYPMNGSCTVFRSTGKQSFLVCAKYWHPEYQK